MLRSLAQRVEAGDFAGLARIVVIVNADILDWEMYGKGANKAELIGLIEYTKFCLLDDGDE